MAYQRWQHPRENLTILTRTNSKGRVIAVTDLLMLDRSQKLDHVNRRFFPHDVEWWKRHCDDWELIGAWQ